MNPISLNTVKNMLSWAFLTVLLIPTAYAQNVGIGTATPLEKLHVIGNLRVSTLAGVGNRMVLADPNGTLLTASGATSPSWMTLGNSGLNGGNTTTAGTNFLGTTDAQNICFRTNNIERGRFSALGEFFVGTLNTVIAGDLMNAVGNPTFPWAVNGYVPSGSNGGGVYGQVQSGNTTIFGSVQGEYSGTSANGAGVRGIAITPTAIGVQGQEPTLFGWAGYFNGDVFSTTGYYIPSDRKLKKDLVPVSNAVKLLGNIPVYSYFYNREQYPGLGLSPRRQYGVLADELELVIPSAVSEKALVSGDTQRINGGSGVTSVSVKTVNYESLIPLLVSAINEQQKTIEELQKSVAALQSQIK
jgi:hypothetical protein